MKGAIDRVGGKSKYRCPLGLPLLTADPGRALRSWGGGSLSHLHAPQLCALPLPSVWVGLRVHELWFLEKGEKKDQRKVPPTPAPAPLSSHSSSLLPPCSVLSLRQSPNTWPTTSMMARPLGMRSKNSEVTRTAFFKGLCSVGRCLDGSEHQEV